MATFETYFTAGPEYLRKVHIDIFESNVTPSWDTKEGNKGAKAHFLSLVTCLRARFVSWKTEQ